MRSDATRLLIFLVLLFLSAAYPSYADNKCNCTPRPDGPGGGVQCEDNQVASCDPSSGVCNCSCVTIEKGKTKEEYLSIIFSGALHEDIKPSDLRKPEYQPWVSAFLNTYDEKKTFYLTKSSPAGSTKFVTIGVPGWLAEVLIEPKK